MQRDNELNLHVTIQLDSAHGSEIERETTVRFHDQSKVLCLRMLSPAYIIHFKQ
jgi:hypothetical protein